ncbi:tagatose-bisphosphate aldolase subunit GatY [Vibrio parahaemolyticus]|uniref:tagatose-bisphosphate aldolase subunit GatY n=1 Tax=Vibrio parahaemolyticus TaxID=670 RepID=UPI00111CF586|nr:tagatose-bisphosphate aldolase subunit GatY [Vibrio parahaemolyticus]MBM4862720.1 tagatose-bisphosphate aldolase subunit GatY [Vibrio parahaemolyticus]MBM4952070.1 tagatose-bisphosphate aldolase subunit GatY [Vibrio parahaemolyticus]MDA0386407.1 tagatose-bisphosphate aldolase subunit GatY [Vibrio parahaemolyticus]MDA0390952.1 tagatose-bisphosphate aldolase subunit GatY [Vibrio parahaemolyticus]MDA0396243.1 tagatose-bisphosphate aldolase subunit GatY [Vibrio parahaemolyticus]
MNNIINSNYLLKQARKNGYAIPAFNFHNLETVQVILDTAKSLESPVILAGTPGTFGYGGSRELLHMVNAAAKERNMQVVVHLDHHHDLNDIRNKVQLGIRSAMIDGSALPLNENIALTREAVQLCHAYGCSVEAEIGQLVGQEDDLIVESVNDPYTHPEDAQSLVEQTNVDSLAIAIGTAHGMYKEDPKLDFDRLEKIASMVDIPLVLHGASGVPSADVQRCIDLGIAKVNVATELKIAYSDSLKEVMKSQPEVNDPRVYNEAPKEAMAKVVKDKILMCRSEGRV